MTAEKVTAYRTMQNEWFNDGNSVSRFSAVYGPLYKVSLYGTSIYLQYESLGFQGVGPHGFSVWGHSSTLCNNGTGCTAIDVKGDCQERGGPHWLVQETAWYASDPNKHGREWHPSAGMHLLRGEILAYNYVHIIMDAILQVQKNLTDSTKEASSKCNTYDICPLFHVSLSRCKQGTRNRLIYCVSPFPRELFTSAWRRASILPSATRTMSPTSIPTRPWLA